MRTLFNCTIRLGVLTLAAAGIFAATASASDPHVEFASASMKSPTVIAPGNITWDNSLVVSFKVAGLPKGPNTATLVARPVIRVKQLIGDPQPGDTNSSTIVGRVTGAAQIEVEQVISPPGGTNLSPLTLTGIEPTFTSTKNGQMRGAFTIPFSIVASTPGDQCVQVSWDQITITVGTLKFSVPDVPEIEYESTEGFCD